MPVGSNLLQRRRDAVETVVKEQIRPARLVDLEIEDDFDHDGDRILRITVVFDAADAKLDASKLIGLARHLREPLSQLDELAFPVFTYMTEDERTGEAA